MIERRVTTQDVSWFLDLQQNKQLNLQPSYQRRSVWSHRDRRYFLDTIFRGYPSPAIFLHKAVDASGRSIHEVVDGKQRLETILMFINNKIAIGTDFGDVRLNGKKWKGITDPELRRLLWDYVLPVEFIRSVEGTIVNEVFDRLNRNSRRLERQELRHAKYDGWLITYVETETDASFWSDVGVVTKLRSKRMKDVQSVSELLMIILHGKVSGFDQDALDELYADYDVPTDEYPDFDPTPVNQAVEAAKHYIGRMVEHRPEIGDHLSAMTNLYTLWGVVALNRDRLPLHTEAAECYAKFMKEVEGFRTADWEEMLSTSGDNAGPALRYMQYATGASTEPQQRETRHEILRELLVRES